MHGLSIIIPTYNEKENLKILIPEIYSIIKVKKFEIRRTAWNPGGYPQNPQTHFPDQS